MFFYTPMPSVRVRVHHAASAMQYLCHVIDYKTIENQQMTIKD